MTGYQSKKNMAQDKLTVDREQVKQWLEALKTCDEDEWHSEDDFGLAKTYDENKVDQAIASCEQALAQPAQRPWVGLTDDDIKEIVGPWGDTPIKGYTRKLFDQIEAALRSKNT